MAAFARGVHVMLTLFGLTPGTFEGTYQDWVKRMHPTDRDRVNQERAACIRQRKSDWKYEYRATLPDGGIRWIEGRSRMFLSKTGSLERIVGASIDVTERRDLGAGGRRTRGTVGPVQR